MRQERRPPQSALNVITNQTAKSCGFGLPWDSRGRRRARQDSAIPWGQPGNSENLRSTGGKAQSVSPNQASPVRTPLFSSPSRRGQGPWPTAEANIQASKYSLNGFRCAWMPRSPGLTSAFNSLEGKRLGAFRAKWAVLADAVSPIRYIMLIIWYGLMPPMDFPVLGIPSTHLTYATQPFTFRPLARNIHLFA
jgi:hypothetical protein